MALVFTQSAHASPNLLVNGSFEDTTHFVSNGCCAYGGDMMIQPIGSTAMTGWTIAGSGNLAWIGPTTHDGLSAGQGSYFLDLTGTTDRTPFAGVTQSIATSTGSDYLLSFDLGSSSINPTLPTGINASAGSVSEDFTSTKTGPNNWETETMSFIATGPTTAITLIGSEGLQYIGLDNVSVTLVSRPQSDVPEPGSMALLGAGLATLGLIRRWRRAPS
jgi:hypothetical protein